MIDQLNAFAAALADRIDPPERPVKPELADPVGLAHHLDPKYQVRQHLRVIAAELADLRRRWLDGSEFEPRLMINTPPQVGKSLTAVEWGGFWLLCNDPTLSIVIGCYDEDLAEDRGGGIKRLVERYGLGYGLQVQRGQAGVKDWSLTAGGSVRAVGIGSGITGHNADFVFIDDPIRSRADADSVRKRDQAYGWYTSDMLTRLAPRSPVVFIQTPWAKDDLRDRILTQEGNQRDGGKWRVVVMPALATAADDPLGRAFGDPIPHPKIAEGNDVELRRWWHAVRAAQSVRAWESLYQCDPQPQEGMLLSWQMLRERRAYEFGRRGVPERRRVGVAVDPSGGGRDVAGIVGGFLGADGRCYWSHDRSGVMSSAEWSRAACELAFEIDADFFVVETNYGGDMATRVIRTAWKALAQERPDDFADRLCPRIKSVRAKRGKMLRAEPIAQQVVEDRINTAAYLPELESEWATWTPDMESPGRIDASVYLAFDLLPMPQTGKAPSMAGAQALATASLMSYGNGR